MSTSVPVFGKPDGNKGYSRRVLSEKTGLSERTIEKIEKGKVNTTAETLYTLINALDMSADYLFKMDKHQADVKCEQVINMLMPVMKTRKTSSVEQCRH